MKIKLVETAEKVPFDLDGRKMFSSEKVEIIHLNLLPGENLELHSNPFDVIFYILEGEGIVETEDEQITVEPDMTIEIASGVKRGVKNVGPGNFRLLVIKIL
ncbi:MAG TPA: cupin domain-containing protein [Williamwhitmania sp.]|nr:cupin domain-containing protein [Williamwhitmania sp.]